MTQSARANATPGRSRRLSHFAISLFTLLCFALVAATAANARAADMINNLRLDKYEAFDPWFTDSPIRVRA